MPSFLLTQRAPLGQSASALQFCTHMPPGKSPPCSQRDPEAQSLFTVQGPPTTWLFTPTALPHATDESSAMATRAVSLRYID